jgi:uncharacterized phage protein (TIGR01671 family)
MRTFKFRVFAFEEDDDGCRGFLEPSPSDTELDFFYDGGWRGASYFMKYPKSFSVQQYTGIKDKNGNEIYEGDILKIHNHNLLEVVEYIAEGSTCFGFWRHDSTPDYAAFESLGDWTSPEGYDIVGNLFENPDLVIKN